MHAYVIEISKHAVRLMAAIIGGLGSSYIIQLYTKRKLTQEKLDKYSIPVMLVISIAVTLLYYPSKNLVQNIYEPFIYWLAAVVVYKKFGDRIFELVFKILGKGK